MAWQRREKIFVGTFLALHALVPLFIADFYPFTAMPMFSDAPRELVRIEIDPDRGCNIDAVDLGLYSAYFANPRPRIGRRPPGEQFAGNRLLNRSDLKRLMRPRLGACKGVWVVQQRLGALDDERAGVVEARRTRITARGEQ